MLFTGYTSKNKKYPSTNFPTELYHSKKPSATNRPTMLLGWKVLEMLTHFKEYKIFSSICKRKEYIYEQCKKGFWSSICLRDKLHTRGWLSRGRTTTQSCSRSRRVPAIAPRWLSTSWCRSWEDSREAEWDSTHIHSPMWSGQNWRRSVCDPYNIFTALTLCSLFVLSHSKKVVAPSSSSNISSFDKNRFPKDASICRIKFKTVQNIYNSSKQFKTFITFQNSSK